MINAPIKIKEIDIEAQKASLKRKDNIMAIDYNSSTGKRLIGYSFACLLKWYFKDRNKWVTMDDFIAYYKIVRLPLEEITNEELVAFLDSLHFEFHVCAKYLNGNISFIGYQLDENWFLDDVIQSHSTKEFQEIKEQLNTASDSPTNSK